MTLNQYYRELGISDKVIELAEEVENSLKNRFKIIDDIAEINQIKVLRAMQEERFSEEMLYGTTGYGYNDTGRDTLERIYARVFGTESALVRQQITCGTHALFLALSGVLRPGDTMLSVAGPVYDTLQGAIGLREETGSLAEFGIKYAEIGFAYDFEWDYEAIKKKLSEDPSIRLIHIQRSRGYDTRPSLSVEQIEEVIAYIRDITKNREVKPYIIVDNCYGEFVETVEPSSADMIVGSLIKNPGGGLAPIGGYIAGTKECIDKCAARLTAPGLGAEVGASLGNTRYLAQGLFMSPTVTAAALKGAIFAANMYERIGFKAFPSMNAPRYDIIQAITLGNPDILCAFCEGIQAAAPVDSYVKPVPWDMPGYDSQVIMAAGAFVSGASIELSADGPLREPYNVYFQGGLTYPHAKFGIMMSLQKIVEKDLYIW